MLKIRSREEGGNVVGSLDDVVEIQVITPHR
jgi:hypothetical protein